MDIESAVDVEVLSKSPTCLCAHVESLDLSLKLYKKLGMNLKYYTMGLYDFSGGKDNRG